MAIAFHFAARSDVGMVRSNNEDSGYAGPHLLAMADGMGGHAGGDVASSTIIAALVDLDGEAHSGAEATERLLKTIAAANADLGARVQDEPELEGMGTTLIALLRARDKLVLAHIGDSRAFLVRGDEVTQITKDHSFVQTLVDDGRLTAEEAAVHPQRSLVTRVLTGNPDDEPDIVVRQAKVGDRYLVASDGLTDYVARDTIDEVLRSVASPAEATERLVQLSLRAGAPDNVTVVIGDVVDLRVGPVPSDQPVVVGAAALSRKGTRPMPVTPAEKAAALAKEASSTGDHPDDGDHDVTLAEEGPPSRGGRIARVIGTLLIVGVVLAGLSYAGWGWTQRQYWVGVNEGNVAIFRGLSQSIGPLNLSTLVERSPVAVADLPANYRTSLADGVSVADRAAADKLVSSLVTQSMACIYERSLGRECATVPDDWTSPSPTPTLSDSPSGPAPSPSSSTQPSRTATAAASTISDAASAAATARGTRAGHPASGRDGVSA